MCLAVLPGTKLQVAKENIVVYKRVHFTNVSAYRSFKYKVDRLYKVPKIQKDKKNRVEVGFHAYRNLGAAMQTIHIDEKIVIGIVPKGSKYYLGWNEEIVSDKFKILSFQNLKIDAEPYFG